MFPRHTKHLVSYHASRERAQIDYVVVGRKECRKVCRDRWVINSESSLETQRLLVPELHLKQEFRGSFGGGLSSIRVRSSMQISSKTLYWNWEGPANAMWEKVAQQLRTYGDIVLGSTRVGCSWLPTSHGFATHRLRGEYRRPGLRSKVR